MIEPKEGIQSIIHLSIVSVCQHILSADRCIWEDNIGLSVIRGEIIICCPNMDITIGKAYQCAHGSNHKQHMTAYNA